MAKSTLIAPPYDTGSKKIPVTSTGSTTANSNNQVSDVPGAITGGNTVTDNPSGGYTGGSGVVTTPTFDNDAYMQKLLGDYKTSQTSAFNTYANSQMGLYEQAYQDGMAAAQKAFDDNAAALRSSTDAANAQIDKNSTYSIDTARTTTDEALRQANILRQQNERALPTLSLMTGGGGMSESALMGVNNQYLKSRDDYNTNFANTQSDVLNQADNYKASNEQGYTQNLNDLRNQLSAQQMEYNNNKTAAQIALEQERANFELALAQMIAQNTLQNIPQYAYQV